MSKAARTEKIKQGKQVVQWMQTRSTCLQAPGIVTHPTAVALRQSWTAARDTFRAQPVGSVLVVVVRLPDYPQTIYYQVFEVKGKTRASTRVFELLYILRVNAKSTSHNYGDLVNPLRHDAFTARCQYELGRFHATPHPQYSVNVAEVWRLNDDIAAIVRSNNGCVLSSHDWWNQQRKNRHEELLNFRLIYEPLCHCSTLNAGQPIAALNMSLFKLIEGFM